MKVTMKTSGFKELDVALSLLPKAAAKSTMLKALKAAAEPIRQAAQSYAPVDTGELQGHIIISTKLANNIGKSDFHEVMKRGGTRKEAGAALRAARGTHQGASFALIYVGPTKATSKKNAIKRLAQEFGTVRQSPQPYMRPAWDAKKMEALGMIKSELRTAIIATARRIGRSKVARYTDTIKQEASIAALIAHEE